MKLCIRCDHNHGKNAFESERTSHTFPPDREPEEAGDLPVRTHSPVKVLAYFLYELVLMPHRLQESRFERNERNVLSSNVNTSSFVERMALQIMGEFLENVSFSLCRFRPCVICELFMLREGVVISLSVTWTLGK